ncbi:MAG: hypothetical protein JWP57_3083 [Spirosoma sp.]|nr:hypothetical protein [Spirosoma sp.]
MVRLRKQNPVLNFGNYTLLQPGYPKILCILKKNGWERDIGIIKFYWKESNY